MHKLMIELNEAQHKAADQHAKKKGRTIGEDVAAVWWGRMKALADYAEKIEDKKAKFRPYTPRLLDVEARTEIKMEAVKAGVGIAPPKKPEPKPKKTKPAKAKKAEPARTKPAKAAPKKKGPKEPKAAPAHDIALYDSEGVARAKARTLSERTGKSLASILEAAGRKADGAIKKEKPGKAAPPPKKKPSELATVAQAVLPEKPAPVAVPPTVKPLTEEMKAKLKAAGIGHPEIK